MLSGMSRKIVRIFRDMGSTSLMYLRSSTITCSSTIDDREDYQEDRWVGIGMLQIVAEVPWGHNLLIINKIQDYAGRTYYLEHTKIFGWSRNVLLNQIKAHAYERS